MTLSLAAVFVPVLFMGGILGRLFKDFAVTICVAVLISGVVSVTLTLMLCSRFLRSVHEQKRSWFYRVSERFFQGCLIRFRPIMMATMSTAPELLRKRKERRSLSPSPVSL